MAPAPFPGSCLVEFKQSPRVELVASGPIVGNHALQVVGSSEGERCGIGVGTASGAPHPYDVRATKSARMPIFDLFSKRRKNAINAGKPVVYRYDEFPESFRIQVIHIWRTALGPWFNLDRYSSDSPASNTYWEEIHNICARELGRLALGSRGNPFERCADFLAQADHDGVLDIVELSFRVIDILVRQLPSYSRESSKITQAPDDAIEELNHRFREHALGYQYTGGKLVRVDSQFVHVEGVERAITLLHDASFEGPNREFLTAHEHYRHGRKKEAIADASKALESTLKAICDSRGWGYTEAVTAKPLLDIVFSKGLIPSFLESHFGARCDQLLSPACRPLETGRLAMARDPHPLTYRTTWRHTLFT